MKTIIALFVLITAYAALAGNTPFNNEQQAEMDKQIHYSVKATYNAAVSGDSAVAHDLGVSLPVGAIITRSFIDVNTAFVNANNIGRVAFHCQTAGNILAANALSQTGPLEGISTGASTVFKEITVNCPVTATVTVGPFTAGSANVFIDYVLSN